MKTTEGQLPLGISGQPNIRNKYALNWSSNGLAAIGCGSDVVILDTRTLNVTANLSSVHKSSVTQVLWNPFARPFLPEKPDKQPPDLVSVDSSNLLVTWDVEKSHSIATFTHPDSKTLMDVKWSNGFDMAQKTKIFLLYSSNTFVILDIIGLAYQNIIIMDSATIPTEYFHFSFDVDPYTSTYCTNLALLTESCISYIQNWDPLKVKQEKLVVSARMFLVNGKGASPGPSPVSNEQAKRSNSTSGIRKLVSDIVGADYPLIPGQTHAKPEGTILYHPNLKDHLIVSSSNQILLVNTYFRVVLSTFNIDRNISPLIQVIPTKQRPALVTLHDNGIIYLRKYNISGLHNISVSLETVCCSDQPRFSSKKSEILGIVLDPKSEKSVILHLIDGRYIQYDVAAPIKSNNVLEAQSYKKQHLITPMTPSVSLDGFAPEGAKSTKPENLVPTPVKQAGNCNRTLGELLQSILEPEAETGIQIKLKKASPLIGSLTCIRSRPNQQLLVTGTSQGFILVFKIIGSTCEIVKRYSAHSNSPVCGIEFISEDEIVSFANLSFSANPKCEMIITHLWTGAMKSLKQDDPFHIGFIRVSPLRQYFILAYKNGMAPCELWDVTRRQLIKTLPSKLPSITCATWKLSSDISKDETFFMTDLGTFLFTFRVEGNRFSSATCVKLDTAGNTGGVPVSLISKGKLVFRGDSSGTLVIYDTEKKTASSGVSIGRGPLLKIEAGDDDQAGLFIAQFNEQVELWDLMEVKKIRSLYNGRHFKAADVCWMNGYLATIPRNSGGIKFLTMDDPQKSVIASSPTLSLNPTFHPSEQKCEKLLYLINSTTSNETVFEFLEEIGAHEESRLWSIFVASLKISRAWNSREYGLNFFSENKAYKETVVKLAQSVWVTDIEKREDVAKVLLLAGEAEKAAEILLDTEPSGAVKYIANGMKAGLCVGSTHLPEATKAVLKIIATNLIACGEIDEGLELLCLLSKHSEAVKYLESSNDWSRAILLSKTSLNEKQAQETLAKYGQYLNTHRHVSRSACVYASIGKFDRMIEVLFGGRKRHLSYLLLTYCDKHGIELPHLTNHVRLAIRLDFARFIFECGLMKEALNFCDVIGNDAKDLKSELEILSS